jgi:uncharacterized protein
MKLILASLAAGFLFGIGLCLSQMTNPARVLGFLDVLAWDPTLVYVMAGALGVGMVGFRWTLRRPKPILDNSFQVATRHDWDWKLLSGAAIFGIGWGISGFCPGPAITALSTGLFDVAQFVLAMLAGMLLYQATQR